MYFLTDHDKFLPDNVQYKHKLDSHSRFAFSGCLAFSYDRRRLWRYAGRKPRPATIVALTALLRHDR